MIKCTVIQYQGFLETWMAWRWFGLLYDLANREMIHWGHITTGVRSIMRYLGSNSAMSKWAIGFLIYTARPRIIAQEL
jgi:hypothetical protein